jgi:hypothetical protein
LSEGLDAPDYSFVTVLEVGWLDKKITGRFIPWTHMARLAQIDQEAQQRQLARLLSLEELLTAVPGKPAEVNMSFLDIEKLADFIGGLDEFQTAPERRRLLEQIELLNVVPDFDPAGAPRDVARNLIWKLLEVGYLSEAPNQHALGKLLCRILILKPDLPLNDVNSIKGLITQYALLPSVNACQ